MTADNGPMVCVLDTNIVLDIWLFSDQRCAWLSASLLAGNCCWLATKPMRDER